MEESAKRENSVVDVKEPIRAFILEYAAGRGVTEVKDDDSLLKNNVIDSLGVFPAYRLSGGNFSFHGRRLRHGAGELSDSKRHWELRRRQARKGGWRGEALISTRIPVPQSVGIGEGACPPSAALSTYRRQGRLWSGRVVIWTAGALVSGAAGVRLRGLQHADGVAYRGPIQCLGVATQPQPTGRPP